MNKLALITAVMLAIASSAMAVSYSTEATLTLNKSKTEYEVAGRVCRLVEREGKLTEEVIAHPKVVSAPDAPGSFYVGTDHSNKNYGNEENVSMEVFWPKKAKDGFATCTITVKRGDVILCKTSTRIQLKAR